MYTKRILLCVDSDGVIADWNPHVTEEETRKNGYFRTCVPNEKLIRVLRRLEETTDVVILTSAYTEGTARADKLWWMQHVAKIDFPVIFTDYGKKKSDCIRQKNAILLDDYSRNLHQWVSSGRRGIKYMNGLNGNYGTWMGDTIYKGDSEEEMLCKLKQTIGGIR